MSFNFGGLNFRQPRKNDFVFQGKFLWQSFDGLPVFCPSDEQRSLKVTNFIHSYVVDGHNLQSQPVERLSKNSSESETLFFFHLPVAGIVAWPTRRSQSHRINVYIGTTSNQQSFLAGVCQRK
ncbi:hypothetical protein [uncultured Roseibium sp.]|uniref:hypothetical protein n=1 Tax=uncultured Roseibium sp. TaxID=1936171 RepID=UPI002602543C|nr:hypothetical protein [uncultured Roseibium sp.]